MQYAAIKISPVFGAKLKMVEVADVMKRRGVKQVVKLDDAVVVIADRFWRARDAAAALNPVFESTPNDHVTSDTISSCSGSSGSRRTPALSGSSVCFADATIVAAH